MNPRSTLVHVVVLLALAAAGCSGRSGGSAGSPSSTAALGNETASAAGVVWNVPRDWTVGEERSMRVATYSIPGAGGAEAGECAVFFFGQGQGGGVDANLQRWVEQFEPGAKSQRSADPVNGLQVTRVRVDGTYLAPAGPMMQSQGSKPGWRLLGAIVEAPEGLVFFKLTGPARTLEGAQEAFEALVGSIKRS